jgi:Tol biopolymer transport system component
MKAAIAAVLGFALVMPANGAPEHAEIAFSSDGRLWSARADGSERRLLVAPVGRREVLGEPVWSPDGSTLAYVSEVGDRSRVMLRDGAGVRADTELRSGY